MYVLIRVMERYMDGVQVWVRVSARIRVTKY